MPRKERDVVIVGGGHNGLVAAAYLEERPGMTDGSFRHLDTVSQQIFARRLPYRSPITGPHRCGGGTHPGGELTGAPGHTCARAILRDPKETVRR